MIGFLGDSVPRARTINDVFLRMPYSCMALRYNLVERPTRLQSITWPLLVRQKDAFIVAPKNAGKLMSLMPIVACDARRTRVIVVSPTVSRCHEIYRLLLFVPLVDPVVYSKIPMTHVDANVVCCTYAKFARVFRNVSSSIVVFDRFDQFAAQGYGMQLWKLLGSVAARRNMIEVVATARSLSIVTREIASQIGFSLWVGTLDEPADSGRIDERVMVRAPREWYGLLCAQLRQQDLSQSVVLIIVKKRSMADHLEARLFEDETM